MADAALGLRSWADLVFHVLAHVAGSSHLAASAYDPRYVAWAERRLGPATDRHLADDARLLSELAPSHPELARLQLLAWLFVDLERPQALASRALQSLEPSEVDDPSVSASAHPAAELLWCACLLELPAFVMLPPPEVDQRRVAEALNRARRWAPGIAECRIDLVRSLCRRGRVRGAEIWVGVPDPELGVSLDHVLWQASHEATVRELGRRAPQAGERDVEHAAVVLLHERALAAGAGADHARWLAHFGANAPPVDRAALAPSARALL